MAVREFLLMVQESAYKTPVASPVLGTNMEYFRLDGGNAFTMRPKPIPVTVMRGGGSAIAAYTVSDKTACAGTLKIPFSAVQASFLLPAALTPINAGQTVPWTTTEPAGDLISFSLYHAITRSDGTIKRRVYLGCKFSSFKMDISSDSQIATLNLGVVGSTPQGNQFDASSDPTSGTFPAPADTAFQTDPYLFIHSAGFVSIASVRTQYDSLSFSVDNVLDVRYFENRYASIIRFLGRKATLEANLYYKPSPDDRTIHEGLTVETVSLELSNGTHTCTFAMEGQNVYTDCADDLSIDKAYMQKLTVLNQYDPAIPGDFAVTLT